MLKLRSIVTGILAMTATLIALLAAGCGIIRGSGRVVSETRAVRGVTGVTLSGQGDLIIEIGDQESLRIEAEDNLIPYLKIEMKNGTLDIGQLPAVWIQPTQLLRFHLTMKTLERVALSGSGNVIVPDLTGERFSADLSGSGEIHAGRIGSPEIELNLSGSGNIRAAGIGSKSLRLDIRGSGDILLERCAADTLDTDISGSGALKVQAGAVTEQKIVISGSGDYDTMGVTGESSDVQVTGSGSVIIRAEQRLAVTISGSGGVSYFGNPVIKTSVTGSGNVRPAE